MKYKIIQSSLTPEVKTLIYKKFAEHSIDAMGFNGLKDDSITFTASYSGINIGLCVVQLFWGNLHIKYLLVNKEYRKHGIGKLLMEHALNFGKEQRCMFAFVETMSFQAPEFYQKLGFKIELKRDGYAADSSFYYLKKDIA